MYVYIERDIYRYKLGKKDKGEKVNVQVVPREEKSALNKCHIHIVQQQQNLFTWK